MARGTGQQLHGAEREDAIAMAGRLIAEGLPARTIKRRVMERYDVGHASAGRYVNAALERMRREITTPPDELLALALRKRRHAMELAIAAGDIRSYLAALDSEAKLLGLNAPDRIELKVLDDRARSIAEAMLQVIKVWFREDEESGRRFAVLVRERLAATIGARSRKITEGQNGDASEAVEEGDGG